jgi:Tol biopolymer transport system component
MRGLRYVAIVVAASGLLAGCLPAPPVPPPPPVVTTLPPPPDAVDRIVFVRADGIWSMHSNGTGALQLTTDGTQPAISPDGRKIVYVRGSSFALPVHLWVMNSDGSDQHELFAAAPPVVTACCGTFPADPNAVRDGSPTWSPDGSRIAFVRDGLSLGPNGLWIMNADGTSGRSLIVPHQDNPVFDLAWSPDGTQFALDYHYIDIGTHVRIADATDGTFVRDVTGQHQVNSLAFEDAAAWSPDGQRLAFYGQLDPHGTTNAGIWVVGADGSHPIQIAGGANPYWSPNGAQIAFNSDGFIWLMNADGSNQHSTGVAGVDPSWSARMPV